MSQDVHQVPVQEKTQELLQGRLKHVRAAGLAAALLPLAAVGAAATSPEFCQSAGVCGFVWYDENNNGVQDPDETGISGAVVTLGDRVTSTNEQGFYEFPVPSGTYQIFVQIPPGTQPSPADAGGDDTLDSDGRSDGLGNSVATATLGEDEFSDSSTDFGFWVPPVAQPGTGTPGYWKNHPEAWPVTSITVGGKVYTQAEALAILNNFGKDKTTTMFSSLVPAMLNVLIGNDSSCISSTIEAANAWMQEYGPVGSGVHAASLAWKRGEPLHRQMDNYNNGMLCAPHRE
jgi:hypothetical protein